MTPGQLKSAIAAVCDAILAQTTENDHRPDERQLWWELSCCLLSSQVPYNMAVAATDALAANRLLLCTIRSTYAVRTEVEEVLRAPLLIDGRQTRYRFHASRAAQLAATHTAVFAAGPKLGTLLARLRCAPVAREWLVREAKGIGLKQASMFLQNVGLSYDLAVLNRHVLVYMAILGIAEASQGNVSTLKKYGRHEEALRHHAEALGYPVGMLDWAIWIVMWTARGLREEAVAT